MSYKKRKFHLLYGSKFIASFEKKFTAPELEYKFDDLHKVYVKKKEQLDFIFFFFF
jgi:hypothetical protein